MARPEQGLPALLERGSAPLLIALCGCPPQVIIKFWKHKCLPCLSYGPFMKRAEQQLKSHGATPAFRGGVGPVWTTDTVLCNWQLSRGCLGIFLSRGCEQNAHEWKMQKKLAAERPTTDAAQR